MQKALTLMNLRLTNVLSDITGVTGLKIIRAILSGEHNPQVWQHCTSWDAKRARPRLPSRWKAITSVSICSLKQALELYDFYDQQLQACDAELEAMYREIDPPEDPGHPHLSIAPKNGVRTRRTLICLQPFIA